MSASRHIHPGQLKMFMTPKEILASTHPVDSHPDGDHALWMEKLTESGVYNPEGTGLVARGETTMADDIIHSGVRNPVILQHNAYTARSYDVPESNIRPSDTVPGDIELVKPVLWDGHHRVAVSARLASMDKRDRYLPVTHKDDYDPPGSGEHERNW